MPTHPATATLALAHACGVGLRGREHPPISSEHLASTGVVALVGAGLYATGACHQVCGKASRDGRRRACEGRVDGREDAEEHGEDVRTHGGSMLNSQYGTR